MSAYALGDESLVMASEENGRCEKKGGVCKQRLIVGFWWLKRASGYSVLFGTIPIMSSRHCDRALQLISYAVIQLTTSLPPAAPPAFDKNRGKLKS